MGIAVDLSSGRSADHFVHQLPKVGQQGDIYRIDWGERRSVCGCPTGFWVTRANLTSDGWNISFPIDRRLFRNM